MSQPQPGLAGDKWAPCSKWTIMATYALWLGEVHALVPKLRALSVMVHPWLSMTFRSQASTSDGLTYFQAFGLASDPTGSLARPTPTSHSLSQTLVCFYYLSLLDTLDSPCLHFDPQPLSLTSVLHTRLSDSVSDRAQHESIRGSPVLEPVGLVNTWGRHLDPNRFKRRITWPADDYPQVTCVYPCMPKAPRRPHAPARK